MPFVLKFGKHKDKAITDPTVPTDYLTFLLGLDMGRHPETKAEVEKELARRRGGDNPRREQSGSASVSPSTHAPSASAISSRARDIVAVGADRLQACAYTNEALAWLLQLLEGSTAPDSDDVPF